MIWLSAKVENNMNSVELIIHYTTEVKQESPHDISDMGMNLRDDNGKQANKESG